MLKEYAKVFSKFTMFFDAIAVVAAFVLGYLLRSVLSPFDPFNTISGYLPFLMLLWVALLHYFGMYEPFRTKRVSHILLIVLKTFISGLIIFTSVIHILKLPFLSRAFIFFIFTFAAGFIFLEKIFLISFLRFSRSKGYNYKNILIIGTNKRAKRLVDAIHLHSEWGLRIIGFMDDEQAMVNQEVCGYPVLGTFKDVTQIVHQNVIDEAIFVVPRSWLNKIEDCMYFFEKEGVRMHLAVDYFEMQFAKAKQTDFNGFPLLTFETTPDKLWHLLIKRLLDIFLSVSLIILLSPVLLLTALLIKITSRGPVLFRQKRCGRNVRTFMLYKFRTMIENAEEMLPKLREQNEMDGPVFKMKNDPRLTTIGGFLRKTSLDELPQLFNVLKGEMSLVGPRPPIPTEVNEYESWQRRRLSMRPGITCLWQVNGRNLIRDFDKWIKLDLYYIDHWSLWLDFKIMLNTNPVVLFGVGAK
ncbi:MAG: sugar transferase [Candidatus Omnitrophica bacterium]|nr:sugar transferase [Candidatus Omnitrophota bacterium]